MKRITISLLFFIISWSFLAQEKVVVLDTTMFSGFQFIRLAPKKTWVFKKGHDPSWAKMNLNTSEWDIINPTELRASMADENGKLEGWLRLKIKLDSSFTNIPVEMIQWAWAATEIYVDGEHVNSFGNTGINGQAFTEYARERHKTYPMPFETGKEHLIAIHFVDQVDPIQNKLKSESYFGWLNLTGPEFSINAAKDKSSVQNMIDLGLGSVFAVLALLFWLLLFQNRKEQHLLFIAITLTLFSLPELISNLHYHGNISFYHQRFHDILEVYLATALFLVIPLTIGIILRERIAKWHWAMFSLLAIVSLILLFQDRISEWVVITAIASAFFLCIYYVYISRKSIYGAKKAPVIGLFLTVTGFVLYLIAMVIIQALGSDIPQLLLTVSGAMLELLFPLSLLVYVALWFKQMLTDVAKKANEVIRITEEKKDLLAKQNVQLETKVKERTLELNTSFENLKATQSQLIQSEKMASLGELTAGIAHEIQNPLNFVNNFSEVSQELMKEMQEELDGGAINEAKEIGLDIEKNLEKINHHGKRASGIIKGMLEHSRTGKGEKKVTDLNILAAEYLKLSYHGIRAKDKTFTSDFKTTLDKSIPKIETVSQDIGRVILNLINNAFYAVNERRKESDDNYRPLVIVQTQKMKDHIEISVKDNGNGIPEKVKEKIFQPFFTTKPAGKGTGLGLSLSYDIVKAHGGELKVETEEGKGTEFIIRLEV